jgi:hypothetical protein
VKHEEFFNILKESPVFKAIDQAQSIEDFLLVRTADFVPVESVQQLHDLQERKQQYEAEFKEGQFKNLKKYLKIIDKMDLMSQFLYFQQGFFEGVKLVFVLGEFSIMTESYIKYLDTVDGK